MKPGKDTAQLAIWCCEEDDPRKIAWWRTVEAPRIFKESADANNVVLGPISFRTLAPGEENAGHPPATMQGTNVRLLIAEAEVVAFRAISQDNDFLADLSYKDLQTLRKVTRKAARPYELTDEECDAIISRHGPQTAQTLLREAVDAKLLH